MATLAKQFGALVRHHRKLAKLSQAQLAEKTDRQPSAIKNIEAGKSAPSFDTLARLAKALDVSARDFFELGAFAAEDGRDDALVDIIGVLSGLPQRELASMKVLIEAAVDFRRV
ncbi:helix-turn-helix transcriptional regulator [Caulobacter sp.]|uniref:helix-turn-helix domain-containing protein n=1 Tax=Caulobacter sp. TaxID=78 RepID=UPI0031D82C93